MSVQRSLSAAAAIVALGLSSHAFAQEAAPAAAPETPPAAAETVAAVPAPISADIVKPEFVATLRQQLQQPVTILSVTSSNKRHEGVQQAEIDKLDEAWKSEAKSDDQPLIAEILSSPLSSYLLYTQAKSAGLFTEIFIMDKFGLNVGQSSVTSDYWQGDEDKFQRTFAVGPDAVFIDEPEYHDETKTWRVQVNLTIVDPASKAAIGAATAEINLTELQRRLQTGI
jgi:Merozoite surface antigen 2c